MSAAARRLRRYLPVELDVSDRLVALLGADGSQLARIDRLLAAGARIGLWACGQPVAPEIAERCAKAGLDIAAGEPRDEELRPACALFASAELGARTGGTEIVARFSAWARREGRPFCAADRPEESTCASAAAGEASGIGVRVFTGGASPGLSALLRDALVGALSDEQLSRFVAALADMRQNLPPGERTSSMRAALEGVSIEVRLRFPDWFDDRG